MAVSLIGEQFATVIQAAGLVGPNFADTASALEPRQHSIVNSFFVKIY